MKTDELESIKTKFIFKHKLKKITKKAKSLMKSVKLFVDFQTIVV